MLLPSVRQRIDALCARWRTLERPAQVAVATIGLLYVAVACVGIYYGPKRYFDFLVSAAQWLASHPAGPLISMALIIVASFPPLPGFSMSVTLCGLAFSSAASHGDSNFWYGASLAIAASVAGACLAFLLIRRALDAVAQREERLPTSSWRAPETRPSPSWFAAALRPLNRVREDRRCRAMDSAIRDRGFAMLVLIRLCPISYGYFNLFFAAMPSVRLPAFALATLLASPRLLLYVYSGRVLYGLMDTDAAKPAGVKWIEGGSAVGGALLAAGLGYYLMAQVNEILAQEEEDDGEDEVHLLSRGGSETNLAGRLDSGGRPPSSMRRLGQTAWLDQRTDTARSGSAASPAASRASSAREA